MKNTTRGCDEPGNDSGPSQKEHPYAVPALPIGSDDLVFVGHPVLVPAPDGSGIVDTKNVDILDLKAIILELKSSQQYDTSERTGANLANDPVQSARGISTREDIFVHEQAPDEVLVLPD